MAEPYESFVRVIKKIHRENVYIGRRYCKPEAIICHLQYLLKRHLKELAKMVCGPLAHC